MLKMNISYEIQKGCFKIKVIESNGADFSYMERVFPKSYYKNEEHILYNDVLDVFELDEKVENIEFYNYLDNMCNEILHEIKEG